ncbi:MAG: hypothetical protein AAF387_11065 [Pseudomonadota bacterium]
MTDKIGGRQRSDTVKAQVAATEPLIRGLGRGLWQDTTYLNRFHMRHGVLRSTADIDPQLKFDANQFYQYSDKALCAMAAASMWHGGDYMEFGSTDLNTFRNFLTAYDIFDLDSRFPDTRFYGFDIFGQVEAGDEIKEQIASQTGYEHYMSLFSHRGDVLESDLQTLRAHNLYVDRCELVQGYFEQTLTRERAQAYLDEGRRVGFACLDCNIAPPYKLVFEFLIDLLAADSFMYLDEYYSSHVVIYFEAFLEELRNRHGLDARLVRNAGGFGALFYICSINDNLQPLEFGTPLRR